MLHTKFRRIGPMVREENIFEVILIYTHGNKLGNTSCVTRVNFGLIFFYNLNLY